MVEYIVASAGETVSELAVRYGFDPIEIARLNGLLPNSVLGACRQIRTPTGYQPEFGKPTACSAKLDESPVIREVIKLGMPKETFVKYFDPEMFYIPRFEPGSRFSGIRSIAPTFYEDELLSLRVRYEPGVDWDGDAEFAFVIATEFKLPVPAWRSRGSISGFAMTCGGFTMLASENEIEVRDDIASKRRAKIDAETRAAEADRKKKAFKP